MIMSNKITEGQSIEKNHYEIKTCFGFNTLHHLYAHFEKIVRFNIESWVQN